MCRGAPTTHIGVLVSGVHLVALACVAGAEVAFLVVRGELLLERRLDLALRVSGSRDVWRVTGPATGRRTSSCRTCAAGTALLYAPISMPPLRRSCIPGIVAYCVGQGRAHQLSPPADDIRHITRPCRTVTQFRPFATMPISLHTVTDRQSKTCKTAAMLPL